MTVQLKNVWLERVDDGGKGFIRCIDGESDFCRPGSRECTEHRGLIEFDMTQGAWEKHKADHIRARIERGREGFYRFDSADFNDDRH